MWMRDIKNLRRKKFFFEKTKKNFSKEFKKMCGFYKEGCNCNIKKMKKIQF